MAIIRRAVRAAAIAVLIWSWTAMLSVTPASATLQFYSIVLTSATGTIVTQPPPSLGPPQTCSDSAIFGCVNPGEVFVGEFAVDTSILNTDGWIDTARVFDFFLPYGEWGNYYFTPNGAPAAGCIPTTVAGTPCNLYSGFNNGNAACGFICPGPAFLIEGGEVVELGGEVHGAGDAPWINFNSEFQPVGPPIFSTQDQNNSVGTYVIDPIPEPASLALFGTGVVALGLIRRRKRTA